MTQTLRVLMLSVDPRVPGGVAQFIETLESRLKNCEVTHIVTGSMPGERESPVLLLRRLIAVPLRVAWLALRSRFDIVHINGSLTPKCAVRDGLILLALRMVRCRHVLVYIHGWRWGMARSMACHRVYRALARFILADAQRILVLAPEFQALLVAMGCDPTRTSITRTMFDGTPLLHLVAEPAPRRRILSLSRFEKDKNLLQLVEGFAQIVGRFPDVDLVLAGDGSQLPAIRSRIAALGLEDRVLLPGYVRGAEKAKLLRDGTIFAFPSEGGEGMPVALLEALGAGMPVIASKAGGIPHVVREPDNGLLLDTVSPATIGRALDELLSSPERCRQIGERNRRYAWERFEAEQVTAEVERLYHVVAGRP